MPLLSESLKNLSSAFIIGALIILALVVGKDVLIPLTLAVILTFMLSPIVRGLTLIRLPRGLAVALVMFGVLASVIGLTVVVSTQLISLTAGIDGYRSNIIEKVRAVTGNGSGESELSKAAEAVDALGSAIQKEMERKGDPATAGTPIGSPAATGGPPPVAATDAGRTIIVKSEDATSGYGKYIEQISAPVTALVLTFLMTAFLLSQYQDLRDRVVRVFGTDHMTNTTSAMSEAGERLSQLFMMQAILAVGYGVFIAVGLWFIGLPNVVLWALVATLMRFVPYIGTFIAAIPPIILAAAVDPGWSMFFATFALFAISEAVMGNVIEPLVLGKRAGISPFAMIATAAFWTLIWGPVGLVLAAPLTMTLIVAGRYVSGLEFFSVLLGDEPALSPPHELYHRLLSDDAMSAAEHIDDVLESSTLQDATDALIFPALSLAAQDIRRGRLDKEQVAELSQTSNKLLDLMKEDARLEVDDAEAELEDHRKVLIVPVRGAADAIAARYLAHILMRAGALRNVAVSSASGLTALADARELRDSERPDVIVLVSVSAVERQQLRYIVRRALRDYSKDRIAIVDFRTEAEIGVPALEGDVSEGAAYCRIPSSAIAILSVAGKSGQSSPQVPLPEARSALPRTAVA